MKYFFILCLVLTGCGSSETPKIGNSTLGNNTGSRQSRNWPRTTNAIPAKPVTLLCTGFVGVARGEKHQINGQFGWSGAEAREVLLSDSDLRDSGRVVARLKPEAAASSTKEGALIEIVWEGLDRTKSLLARGVVGAPLSLQHIDAKGVRRELLVTCKAEDVEVPFLEEPIDLVCEGPGFEKAIRWDGKAAKKVVLVSAKPAQKNGELAISFTPAQGATAKKPERAAMMLLSATDVDGHMKTMVSTAAPDGRARLELRDSATKREIVVECHKK